MYLTILHECIQEPSYHTTQHGNIMWIFPLARPFLPPHGSDIPQDVIFKCLHQFIPQKFRPLQYIMSAHDLDLPEI